MDGATVSHFTVGEEIGRGEHGSVHRAVDRQLGRAVAIKFLRPASGGAPADDEAAGASLLREARLASALDHPHVGTIYEAGHTDDGRIYVAMAYYGGGSLRDRLGQGALPPADAARLVRQVAAGLAHAHAQGVVHGDVKPDNILFADDGTPKLVDFGVAQAAGGAARPGMIAGTPAYMAPEQAAGRAVGPPADVFALGLLFYEVLAGRRAFAADYEAALRYSLAHEDPPPLEIAVDPRWQAVLDRALAKEPEQRYADAGAFLAALDEALQPVAATVAAAPPQDAQPRRRQPRRRLLVLPAVAVALAVLAFVALRPSPSSTAQDALAVLDFVDLSRDGDPTLSASVTGLIHVGLIENSPVRVVSPEFLLDLRRRHFAGQTGAVGEADALELARRAGASLLLSGQIVRLEGHRLVTWRLVETAGGQSVAGGRVQEDALTAVADRVIGEVVGRIGDRTGAQAKEPASVAQLTTTNSQAYRHFVAGKLAKDSFQIEEAIGQLQAAVRLDPTFALAQLGLSEIFYSGTAAGVDFGAARAHANLAWAHRDRLGAKDRLRLEAWLARLDYRIEHALEVLRELHARWPDDRVVLEDLHNLLFYFWYGDQALVAARTGLQLYPDDDLHFGLFYQIGLEQTGRVDEALAATRSYLQRHVGEPNAWDELGWRFLAIGRSDSAEAAFGKALTLDAGFFPSHQGQVFAAYARGDLAEAVRRGEALLASPDLLPGQRVEVLTANLTWPGLSVCHAEAGRFRDARAQHARAAGYLTDPVSRLRNASSRALLELRLGDPAAVLAWTDSLLVQASASDDPAVTRLAGNYHAMFRPLALAASDSLAAARALLPRLQALTSTMGGQALYYGRLVGIAIALREGDGRAALRLLDENAAQVLPPGGLIALMHHEARAQALVIVGDPERALEVLDDLTRIYGGDARALLLRGRALEAAGRPDEAVAAYRAFLTAWSTADPGLAFLAEATDRLAALGAVSLQ